LKVIAGCALVLLRPDVLRKTGPDELKEKTAQAKSDIKRDAHSLGRRGNLETSIVSFVLAWSVTLSS
jgi:hypothetical protein